MLPATFLPGTQCLWVVCGEWSFYSDLLLNVIRLSWNTHIVSQDPDMLTRLEYDKTPSGVAGSLRDRKGQDWFQWSMKGDAWPYLPHAESNRLKSLTMSDPKEDSWIWYTLEASVFSPTDNQVVPVGADHREGTEHIDPWPNFLTKSMWQDFWALLCIVEQSHLFFLSFNHVSQNKVTLMQWGILYKTVDIGAGRVFQWLRAPAALADDLISLPRTHVEAHNHL